MFSEIFFFLSWHVKKVLPGRNRCKKNQQKQAKTKEEVEKQVHRSEEIWQQRDSKTQKDKKERQRRMMADRETGGQTNQHTTFHMNDAKKKKKCR